MPEEDTEGTWNLPGGSSVSSESRKKRCQQEENVDHARWREQIVWRLGGKWEQGLSGTTERRSVLQDHRLGGEGCSWPDSTGGGLLRRKMWDFSFVSLTWWAKPTKTQCLGPGIAASHEIWFLFGQSQALPRNEEAGITGLCGNWVSQDMSQEQEDHRSGPQMRQLLRT